MLLWYYISIGRSSYVKGKEEVRLGDLSKRERFFQLFQPETYIAVFLLLFLTILLSIQVFVRFVIGGGLAWTEELSRYVFVWSVYFGCVLAVKEDKHIRVTAQFLLLPKRAEKIVIIVSDIIWILFNGMVAFFSFHYVLSIFEFPFISQTMGFNLAWIYTIIPIAYTLMLVYVVLLLYKRIKKILKEGDIHIIDSRLNV